MRPLRWSGARSSFCSGENLEERGRGVVEGGPRRGRREIRRCESHVSPRSAGRSPVGSDRRPSRDSDEEHAGGRPRGQSCPAGRSSTGRTAPAKIPSTPRRGPAKVAPVKAAPAAVSGKAEGSRLFRFFDFTVEPGKKYVYRVTLAVQNPNYGMEARYLEDKALAVPKYLTNKPAEATQSAAISVPRDNRLFAVSVTPPTRPADAPFGKVMVQQFVMETGKMSSKEFDVVRGKVLNFYGESRGGQTASRPHRGCRRRGRCHGRGPAGLGRLRNRCLGVGHAGRRDSARASPAQRPRRNAHPRPRWKSGGAQRVGRQGCLGGERRAEIGGRRRRRGARRLGACRRQRRRQRRRLRQNVLASPCRTLLPRHAWAGTLGSGQPISTFSRKNAARLTCVTVCRPGRPLLAGGDGAFRGGTAAVAPPK